MQEVKPEWLYKLQSVLFFQQKRYLLHVYTARNKKMATAGT
jgi:hypothetical protein